MTFHNALGRPAATAAVLCGLALATASGAAAQAAAEASESPFTALKGNWQGSGTITLQNGNTERLRCRATYQVDRDGSSLQQNLACTSDNYNFELRSGVEYDGGNITGTWMEVTRNLEGKITGKIRDKGEIRAAVQSPNFSASISIATRGNKQAVTIRSPGTELTQVNITLDRKG
ncbi:hypothetical protein [Prosthecomicrobium sp. N25]|uniref:hypothetical protein n=1 Tax=Prosthecomicrobium sp. N25 TaxID=3129254 RepID=UPI0030778B9D